MMALVMLTACGAINEMRITQQMDLGNRYLEELNYEEAVIAFQRVIELEDRNVDAWLGLAEASVGLAEAETGAESETYYKQAIDAYTTAIELEPQKSESYLALADLYEKRGMPEEAIAVLESALTSADDTGVIKRRIEELQEKYYPAEDSDNSTHEDAQNPETILTDFAEERTYLYGRQYNGYLSRIADSGDSLSDYYRYDISEIPFDALGYVVSDLDGDGQPELLIVGLSDKQIPYTGAGVISKDHTITLSVYEYMNGGVALTDEIDLADEEFSVEAQLAISEYMPGLFDCYLYGDNYIGLEIADCSGMLSDGVRLNFISVHYDGTRLLEEGRAWYVGSDGQYDGIYMSELKSLGINGASWQDLFERYHYVRDYVTNYQEIAVVVTNYLVSIEEYTNWRNSGEDGTLKCTDIYFYGKDEIAENTQRIRDASDSAGVDVIDSGTHSGLIWTLYRDGTLTFSGNGVLQADRSNEVAYGNQDMVRNIVIEEGVTGINNTTFDTPMGDGVMPWFFDVYSITIPASVEYIRDAFGEVYDLEVIYGYSGSAAEEYAEEMGVTFIAIDNQDY